MNNAGHDRIATQYPKFITSDLIRDHATPLMFNLLMKMTDQKIGYVMPVWQDIRVFELGRQLSPPNTLSYSKNATIICKWVETKQETRPW